MKLPWVSRAALDRAINASFDANQRALLAEARLDAALAVQAAERARYDSLLDQFTRLAVAQDAMRDERARYDSLLDQFTRLRVAGAVLEPKPPVEREVRVAEHDELKALIDEKCGSDYRKRALMLRQLAADRASSVPDADIRAAILYGVPSNGVPA